MKTHLKKLKLTTAKAAPPPTAQAFFQRKVKSHLQLVRELLAPVGSFIVEHANGDGMLEMRIW